APMPKHGGSLSRSLPLPWRLPRIAPADALTRILSAPSGLRQSLRRAPRVARTERSELREAARDAAPVGLQLRRCRWHGGCPGVRRQDRGRAGAVSLRATGFGKERP